ncbi:MAG: hypothetical protein KKE94_16135 [Gammaproteobacteria bacterium]|uniref:hypothetical protein n=1 Tax=Alishewanella sp. HL-SH05 TaxID=3461145 RepID=UPI004041E52D|nr:hypothetical protein [Gammaproteobacteria bacterium]
MGKQLSYCEWISNLDHFKSVIGKSNDKKLKSQVNDYFKFLENNKVKNEHLTLKLQSFLRKMRKEDRDKFNALCRNKKYMEGKTQIRIDIGTREQLKSLMQKHDWGTFDEAVSELINFFSANGG